MVLNLTLLAMRGVCHNVVINIYVLFQRTRKALTLSTAGTVIWIRTSRFYIQKFKGDWNMCTLAEMCENFLIYTGCPRRNVSDFGRVFLMLKYTDITQNTCVQSWTVTEIMAREKCGLLAGPRTVPVSWQVLSMWCPMTEIQLTLAVQLCSRRIPECAVRHVTSVLAFLCHV